MQTHSDWQRDWAKDNLKSLLELGGDFEKIDAAIEYLGEEGEELAREYDYEIVCGCGNSRLPELTVCRDCL